MVNQLIASIENKQIDFKGVLEFIEKNYKYTPSAFSNGNQHNEADQNQGSAKVLFFAKLNNLSKEDTLKLFVEHYQSVLENPNGTDHQNIRQFMLHGFEKVIFANDVLVIK